MASRADVVLVRSEVLDSIKDLTGQWNDNDYQRLRVRKVLTIVDRFFLSGEPLIFEQRALVDVFSGLVRNIGKDPRTYIIEGQKTAKRVADGRSSQEDRKELLSFFYLLKSSLDNQLKGE